MDIEDLRHVPRKPLHPEWRDLQWLEILPQVWMPQAPEDSIPPTLIEDSDAIDPELPSR